MKTSTTAEPNSFVRTVRKIYNPVGFSRGYNFVLFFIFGGALLGFTLARFQFLSADIRCSQNGVIPGECYYYDHGYHRIGITLHLATILPAGFLAVLQFVPKIRHKVILFHRLNGYVVSLLALLGNVGAIMIGRHTAGGGLDTQTAMGLLAIMTTGSLVLAIYNVKRLQIDQHRAWMLRAWFYFGSIITLRIIQTSAANIMSLSKNYYQVRPCGQIQHIFKNQTRTQQLYPACAPYFNGTNPQQQVAVLADFGSGRPDQIAASLGLTFGMSAWLALAIHAFGVEVYLHLTPKETHRLRVVSFERQQEAGFSKPGRAGLTTQHPSDPVPTFPRKASNSEADSDEIPLGAYGSPATH